jgi:flagellar biosynthetic protein FliQ
MTPDTVLEVGQQALKVTAMLAAPMLISVLIIGLIVGMFQTVTSIQEMTLSFIPKLIVLALVLAVGGPWMLNLITDFMYQIFTDIPNLIG